MKTVLKFVVLLTVFELLSIGVIGISYCVISFTFWEWVSIDWQVVRAFFALLTLLSICGALASSLED